MQDIQGRNEQVGVIVYGEQVATNQALGKRWMRAYNDAFGPNNTDRDQVMRVLTENTSVTDPAIYFESGQVNEKPDLSQFQQIAVEGLGAYT